MPGFYIYGEDKTYFVPAATREMLDRSGYNPASWQKNDYDNDLLRRAKNMEEMEDMAARHGSTPNFHGYLGKSTVKSVHYQLIKQVIVLPGETSSRTLSYSGFYPYDTPKKKSDGSAPKDFPSSLGEVHIISDAYDNKSINWNEPHVVINENNLQEQTFEISDKKTENRFQKILSHLADVADHLDNRDHKSTPQERQDAIDLLKLCSKAAVDEAKSRIDIVISKIGKLGSSPPKGEEVPSELAK